MAIFVRYKILGIYFVQLKPILCIETTRVYPARPCLQQRRFQIPKATQILINPRYIPVPRDHTNIQTVFTRRLVPIHSLSFLLSQVLFRFAIDSLEVHPSMRTATTLSDWRSLTSKTND